MYSISETVYIIRDGFRVDFDDFEYAYDMFERELGRLKELTRPLSQKEKHLLTSSFNSLVDLHTLLHEGGKEE